MYRRTTKTITDNGFIVKNQNVKLVNIDQIKEQNGYKTLLVKYFLLLFLSWRLF